MKILYKYTSHHSFLDDRKIKFSSVNYFNDPYEINPSKDFKNISMLAKNSYEKHSAQKTKETYKHRIPINDIKTIEENFFESEANESIKNIYNKNLEKLKSELFILCLSKNSTNPLMWAHYASGHKGFCIGFDGDHEFFSENSFEVEYSNKRFSPTCIDPKSLIGILHRKSLDWSYEDEVRVIKTKGQINFEKNPDSLLEVPKNAIKELCVGISSDTKLKEKCLAFSNTIGIPFYEIVESIDSFKFQKKLIFKPAFAQQSINT